MKNALLNGLKQQMNMKTTENGAPALKSTLNSVLDMFALGGSYRSRSDSDCITLFQKAYEADSTLSLRCLFWIRDIRGGSGERRFFRVCYNWLANNYPEAAERNLEYVSEMGRWDDYYALVDTPLEEKMFAFLHEQLKRDCASLVTGDKEGVSLLGKWLPSENASSYKTKILATKTRKAFGLTSKQYRKILTALRARINVVESLMSANRWNEISFDKLPSKAGFRYRNAFARRDLIAQKYKEFIKSDKTTVNSKDLFVHEIVAEAINVTHYHMGNEDIDREVINKYWENLPNYFDGKEGNILCVCDTSNSMSWYGNKNAPINAAIGLSMYCAERLKGSFHNTFITFSANPELVEITGADFVDKVQRIHEHVINQNTNLQAVFDLLLKTAVDGKLRQEDLPEKIVVLSDMEIDGVTCVWNNGNYTAWTKENSNMMMEDMVKKWKAAGYAIPRLVFWNLDARSDTFLMKPGDSVSFISGWSQQLLKNLLSDKDSVDLMLQVLDSERYLPIK